MPLGTKSHPTLWCGHLLLGIERERNHEIASIGIGENLGKNWRMGKNMLKIYGMKFS